MADGQTDPRKDPTNILGQLLLGQSKKLQQLGGQQVEEAFQQGVPLENIAQQIQSQSERPEVGIQALGQALAGEPQMSVGQPAGPSAPAQAPVAPQQAQAQPQAPQQAPQQQLPQLRQILGGLIRQTGASRQQDLQNKILEQQILGTTPAQQGDLQKLAIKQAQDLDKSGSLTASNLLNKFEPVANAFQGIFDSHQRVLASVENPSPAGDLALIFNFMKILDPASVVRESEFATAQNSASVPERVRNIYNSFISGERLGFKNSKQRKDFVDRAGKLFRSKEKSFNNDRRQFARLAKKNKIDPDKVFRNVGAKAAEDAGAISSMTDEQLQAIIGGQ